MRALPLLTASALSLCLYGCSSDTTPNPTPTPANGTVFPKIGSITAASGQGTFRFGVASAATQIEDQNTHTDWYLWTDPKGLAKSPFVGDASMGYTKALDDVQLLEDLHLDGYRFSVEWARVEPKKGMIDEAALDHYSKLLDALIAKGIRPMITIHHFSNPVWVADPRDPDCKNGPSDQNLCGLGHPQGGPLVVQAMADFAKLLAERFGDRVDEWGTLNEPMNYLLAAYAEGRFPPGKTTITDLKHLFIPVARDYLKAHVAMYQAIKAADKVDADGDGVAAAVGLTKEAVEWVPTRKNQLSNDPADLAAKDRVEWLYNILFVECLEKGGLDTDFDGKLDEQHPEWKGTLDWIGVQYYARDGVTASSALIKDLGLTPCLGGFDLGSCAPLLDPTYYVPLMKYEHDPVGVYGILKDFSQRWPTLPLVVTESGIATTVGKRRAEVVVRDLEQLAKARAEGVDVRGYYHWSIYDNFEWDSGFKPRFGLYTVDFKTYARTPTEGATVLGEITKDRTLTDDVAKQYGGTGPLTPEAK